jgi:hypothetical protein
MASDGIIQVSMVRASNMAEAVIILATISKNIASTIPQPRHLFWISPETEGSELNAGKD